MADIFLPHPNHPKYLSNINGVVMKTLKKSFRIMDGSCNIEGYLNVNINGKLKRRHRFVYECWRGIIPDGLQIDHVDGDKANNKLDNLQALTPQEHRHKTVRQQIKKIVVSARNRPLQCTFPDGSSTTYESVTAACGATGIRRDAILRCLCDRTLHRQCTWQWSAPTVIEGEVWCSLYGEHYSHLQVSSKGRIKFRSGRVSFGFSSQGYQAVSVGGKRYKVHRLICLAFNGLPPSPEHDTVDHIDMVKTNNCIENLRWATMKMQNNNKRNVR